MDDSHHKRYSIGEIAELAGINRRTVRFYVQQQVIDAPLGKGRGRHYTQLHVEQIQQVRRLQRQGLTVEQMRALRRAASFQTEGAPIENTQLCEGSTRVYESRMCVRVQLEQGITLDIEAGAQVPSQEQLLQIQRAVRAILNSRG